VIAAALAVLGGLLVVGLLALRSEGSIERFWRGVIERRLSAHFLLQRLDAIERAITSTRERALDLRSSGDAPGRLASTPPAVPASGRPGTNGAASCDSARLSR
jgi:hypothetical protein